MKFTAPSQGAGSSGGSSAPNSSSFLTLGVDAGLTNERVLTAGTNISFVDGGSGSTLTINATGGAGVDGSGTANKFPIWSDADTLADSIMRQATENSGDGVRVEKSLNGTLWTGCINTNAGNACAEFALVNNLGSAIAMRLAGGGWAGTAPNEIAANEGGWMTDSAVGLAGIAIILNRLTGGYFRVVSDNFTLASNGDLTVKDNAAIITANKYTAFNTGAPMLFTAGNGGSFAWTTGASRMTLSDAGTLTVVSGNIVATTGDITVSDSANYFNGNNFSVLSGGATMAFVTAGGAFTFDSNITVTGTTLWMKSVNGGYESKIKNTHASGYGMLNIENNSAAGYLQIYTYGSGHASANQSQIFHQGGGITIQSYDAGSFLKLYAPEVTIAASGKKVGFFDTTPVVKQASAANLTNNVTSGGTDDTIADYSSLTIYATDAAAIRNNIYQLARKLKQVNDGLRAYGILT